jgi:PKD repeat protein
MDIVAYNGECLCESFMKHPNASVAVNGAIIPSYTIPNHDYDKEMYKAVFDENITNIGYVTNFANVTVLNVHGTIGRSNVRTYLWLGDASIEPWTKQPMNLTVTHDDQIFLGISEFSVTVIGSAGAAENAMVCVSNEDGSVYGVAYTDATGVATIVFDEPVQTPGEANITVTLHNYLPYQAVVPVIPQEGPYVVKDSYTINDAAGNNNGMLDYGEAVLLSLSVKNVGVVTAENVTITISTDDTYVTITDDTEVYGNIDPNQVVTITDGFALEAAENIPDGHAVLITVSASDGSDTWSSNIVIMGHAPALAFDHFIIDDSNGNNNGFLDPGETVIMTVTVANEGSADAYNVMGLLSGTDPYVTVGTLAPQAFGNLSATAMAEANFTVSAAANTPFGYTAQLTLDLTADMGIAQQDVLEIVFSDYCDASTSVEDEYISNVLFGEINNSSGWQGLVADYTDITNTMQAGVGQPITITNGNAWAADIVYVWIDWNLNKEFGNTNETYMLTNVGGQGQTFTGTITPPAGQSPGPYRMRVRMTYSTPPTPCGAATYGEIEDYTVVIAGINVNFSANVTNGCPGLEVQFTDNSTGGGTQWEWQFPGGTPETSTEQNPVVMYNTSGVYDVTLTVTGPLGTNTMTKTAYISVTPMPAVPGDITGDIQGCQGYTEIYTVSPIANANSYVWSLDPAEAGTVVSQTMNEISILWSSTYEGAAIIKVCGVNECGEGGWSADFNVAVENCVGIGENDNNASLSIYPNPSNGKFTIELNANDVVSINLINALGESVYTIESVEVKGNFYKTIETGNLSEGVYYLKIEGESTTINKKVVISR